MGAAETHKATKFKLPQVRCSGGTGTKSWFCVAVLIRKEVNNGITGNLLIGTVGNM